MTKRSHAERVARADSVIAATVARADAAVTLTNRSGRRELRMLIRTLEQAQSDLEKRLRILARRAGGPTGRFTEASHRAYLAQLRVVIRQLRARLMRQHNARTTQAIDRGWHQTRQLLTGLEAAYTGVSRPLRIGEASVLARAKKGMKASLLAEHATSMDRYGSRLVRQMESTMARGMLTGASQSQVIDALVGMRGPSGVVSLAAIETPAGVVRTRLAIIPEGLFVRSRAWAVRIVRTETARAQNLAAHEAILTAHREDFPDLQKKILAMLDDRTAPDSMAVHGQVRDVDQPFTDGAGRVYMMPPARPNDRETVVPWRARWGETPSTRPAPAREVARAMARASETPPGGPRNVAQLRAWVSEMRRT